jgi:hypothetical protein
LQIFGDVRELRQEYNGSVERNDCEPDIFERHDHSQRSNRPYSIAKQPDELSAFVDELTEDKMALTAIANAKSYAWGDWLLGLMRAFLSGGAIALTTGTGGAIIGIPSRQVWMLMGINFIVMGLYRLGEFLQLHGAPDKLQQTLQTAQEATTKAGEAIATAKTQVEEKPK